jgi:hypothetical protein
MCEEILQLYSSQSRSESLAIKILLSTTGLISTNITVKIFYFIVPLVVVADVRVVVAVVDTVVEMVELGAVDEMAGVVAVVISTTI